MTADNVTNRRLVNAIIGSNSRLTIDAASANVPQADCSGVGRRQFGPAIPAPLDRAVPIPVFHVAGSCIPPQIARAVVPAVAVSVAAFHAIGARPYECLQNEAMDFDAAHFPVNAHRDLFVPVPVKRSLTLRPLPGRRLKAATAARPYTPQRIGSVPATAGYMLDADSQKFGGEIGKRTIALHDRLLDRVCCVGPARCFRSVPACVIIRECREVDTSVQNREPQHAPGS
jgi:hypothetical protein